MKEVKLGLMFPYGGIGVGYMLLTLAGACYYLIPHSVGLYFAIGIMVLLYAIIQFSFWSIQAKGGMYRKAFKILNIFTLGKWASFDDLEAFYTRSANVSSNVYDPIAGFNMVVGAPAKAIKDKSFLVEIKRKNDRKYEVFAACKGEKAKLLAETIFIPAGIKHEKILPKFKRTDRRR